MGEPRTWQIVALLHFPVEMAPAGPTLAGQLPRHLMALSRIPARQEIKAGGTDAVLMPWPGPELHGQPPMTQPAALALRVQSLEAADAIAGIGTTVEALVDVLAFQLQHALHTSQLEALDVTPPVEVGEICSMHLYPAPAGYPVPKFSSSVAVGDLKTVLTPTLDDRAVGLEREHRAALRWYIKSLDAVYDADKFMLLWIALEILCVGSATVVTHPYRAPCGHQVPECPECGRSTFMRVNGATVQLFLREELGVEEAAAREMWKMRQMFHGRSDLTADAVSTLSRLVMGLRAAVVRGLKVRLGYTTSLPPLPVPGVPAIGRHMFLSGTRPVSAADLAFWPGDERSPASATVAGV